MRIYLISLSMFLFANCVFDSSSSNEQKPEEVIRNYFYSNYGECTEFKTYDECLNEEPTDPSTTGEVVYLNVREVYVPICHFDSRSQQLIDCECLLVGEDTLNIQTEEDGFALIATVDECELGELQKVVHE